LAIVQISRITNRKGLQENLPQLAGAELGWSIDERRLFIGNGTLEEGAPVVGNTEILTEFSDILNFTTTYTYKGEAAGYVAQTGATPGTPVSQSLQSWLDQFATVKDFGAVGDGVADDTAAINRALFQLYCVQSNTAIRRGLFFPAGLYRVTESILIPPYAFLYGEGVDSSIIQLDTVVTPDSDNACTARTCDNQQQYGANIGTNSATPPQNITVSNMRFENVNQVGDVFIVQSAENCRFQSVAFIGPMTPAELTTEINDSAAVRFLSTVSLVTSQIVFDDCLFGGTVFGATTADSGNTDDQSVRGVTISNGAFDTLFQGVVLGSRPMASGQTSATGVRVIGNVFDNIYVQGIVFGTTQASVSLNASGHNIFYDVGNHFNGVASPASSVISIWSNNNISISDMFERTLQYATTYPRVAVNFSNSFGFNNTDNFTWGSLAMQGGSRGTLQDNSVLPITIATVTAPAFCFNYRILRGSAYRTGTITVTFNPSGATMNYNDDFSENASTGITLTVQQSGTTALIRYVSTSTGVAGSIQYNTTRFNS
jgi:hypothetical protein